MMGYYYDSFMGSWGLGGPFIFLMHLEMVVIGLLVIAFLWKKIQK